MVLRYSSGSFDCIGKHKEVLDKYGYCWFGKIGSAPSIKMIEEKLNPENPLIVLYNQGKVHLCRFSEAKIDTPECGFPEYYKKQLFEKNNYPCMYFKLTSIEEIKPEDLKNCVNQKSRNNIMDTVSRSMASFFYGEYPEKKEEKPLVKPSAKRKTPSIDKQNQGIKARNTCIFRIDGFCTDKKCINHDYECDRPSFCARRKPG